MKKDIVDGEEVLKWVYRISYIIPLPSFTLQTLTLYETLCWNKKRGPEMVSCLINSFIHSLNIRISYSLLSIK